jgi:phage terminase large subunit-like protein
VSPKPSHPKTLPTSTCSDAVTAYAEDVVEGRIVAGPLVRAAGARHLRDIQEQAARAIVWEPEVADMAIRFFPDVLRLNGGEFEGVPFELQPFQKFIVGSLFGWFGVDGLRRFRVAYVEMGKGNGKSPLAAGIGLKMEVADKEPRAEVYAAATKKDQAMILFRDAVAMRDQSPKLAERLERYGGAHCWNLFDKKTGSFFRVISSEDSQSGPRPHCGLIDELHEHPNAIVVDMMRAGTKGRRQALIFEITNSGFDRNTVCWAHHEYSERVLTNQLDDESWFAYVCGLDQGDDWRDEAVWPKANPNLGVSITHKYLREQVREAVGMPSKQSVVKRLNFCEWVGSDKPWIATDVWLACEHYLSFEEYAGRVAYGGLDLSGKNDLSALVLDFPTEDGHDAFSFFWTPGEGIKEREERDRVPYSQWVREKHLQTTPGRSIDYGFIAQKIGEIRKQVDLRAIAFDRWRIDDLLRELDDIGIVCEIVQPGEEPKNRSALMLVPHGQGFKDMSPAVETLETTILNGEMRVAKNPAMTMCALNAACVTDPAGSRKFDKRPGKSTGRIDGTVALAMAHRCAAGAPKITKSVYEQRGLLSL